MKMKKVLKACLLTAAAVLPVTASAQLSQNPNKFLGNITTSYNVDAGGGVPNYWTLWNQITCENESKWSSVEGTRGSFNWGGADRAFNYAQQHDFTYKFHALVWGAQYPNWLESLSAQERFSAMTNWYNHAKEKYNTLPMIDVVNEAVGTHQQGNPMMKETLGGGGKTGFDWLIKAFEMAYERWPDAILIYNDYNSIRWDIDNYITLVQTLRDAGAPIDAYGNQSHDVSDISASELSSALKKQQDALKMPMFITELDIDKADDAQQKAQYQKVLPLMWEAPYCAGVTLWGYVLGATWVDNSGLYRNGAERPAMTWIKEYMQTDAAKNAAGPLPGTKKEASVYIRPASLKVAKGDVQRICVRARLATKTIEKVELYVNNTLEATMTEEPYIAEYTTSKTGWNTTRAVVTATDGTTYERHGRFQVLSSTTKHTPYNEVPAQLPGVLDAMEYDKGAAGVAYYNAVRSATSATRDDAWMDFTVDVMEDGLYTLDVEVASTKDGGSFHLSEMSFDGFDFLTGYVDVPKTGSASTFQTVRCPMTQPLKAGRHTLTLNIGKGGFYIKSLTFNPTPVIALPGTLEVEDFDLCSDGINIVGGNGGSVLTGAAEGQWLEFTVDAMGGKYSYEATVSSEVTTSKFLMTLIDSEGNEKSLGSVTIPKTGSLDTYQVKTGKIRTSIPEGRQKLRITVTGAGFNLDKLNFICTDPVTGISDIAADNDTAAPAYNLSGQKVGQGYKGIVIRNGRKTVVR